MQKPLVHMLDLKSYYLSPAYQLGLLVAYARGDGDIRKAVDFIFTEHSRCDSPEQIATVILKTGADLVCASNYAWTYKRICQVLNVLASANAPLPRVVLGGPNCAGSMGDHILNQYPIVSALVDGEGEPAFLDICRAIADSTAKDPFVNARNCVVRTEDGTIARSNVNHRIQRLDDVPSPYLTGVIPPKPAPVFYETNRGCPYRCAFCYWGNGNAKVFRMSHARIREEMEFFARHNVAAFWIADANFGLFGNDAEIAEMMAQINARYGYPFKHVGVNWAKGSSHRVLEIASILKRGRMGCTTTLALQTVTREAEQKSRRYVMKPSQFVDLVGHAERRQIDTYTDIIWGLPGESVDEYLEGLGSVIATGVPAINIHQLYLLPGTELYDDREKFGLVMAKQSGDAEPDPGERSDYWDYIVVEHPKMRREDWIRGNRILAINHVLHNHDLGRVVSFYLARYGKSHCDVYAFFEKLILGQISSFPEHKHPILGTLRTLMLAFAGTVGVDELFFYRRLSDAIWFRRDDGHITFAEPAVRAFMLAFFRAFCQEHAIGSTPDEADLLTELVEYNVLISPKPAWKPRSSYVFSYNVHAMWQDILGALLEGNVGAPERWEPGSTRDTGRGEAIVLQHSSDSWQDYAHQVRGRLSRMLTDEYVRRHRGRVTYVVSNPWSVLPSKTNTDWILSSRSRHCRIVTAA